MDPERKKKKEEYIGASNTHHRMAHSLCLITLTFYKLILNFCPGLSTRWKPCLVVLTLLTNEDWGLCSYLHLCRCSSASCQPASDDIPEMPASLPSLNPANSDLEMPKGQPNHAQHQLTKDDRPRTPEMSLLPVIDALGPKRDQHSHKGWGGWVVFLLGFAKLCIMARLLPWPPVAHQPDLQHSKHFCPAL